MQVTDNALGLRSLNLHTPLVAPQCRLSGVLLEVLALLIADRGAVSTENLPGSQSDPSAILA